MVHQPMQRLRRGKERGWTMLELLLLLLVLSAVSVWGLQSVIAGQKLAEEARRGLLAAKSVQEDELERLRSMTFSDPRLDIGEHVPLVDSAAVPLPIDQRPSGLESLRNLAGAAMQNLVEVRYWVEDAGMIPNTLKRVTVRVRWIGADVNRWGNGRTLESMASTLIGRQGLTAQ